MNLLIKRFLWKLLSAPIVHEVHWTKEERASFDLFIRSSCGIKLFEVLRQYVASKTFNAVINGDSLRACSEAKGCQELLGLLYRLRNFPADAGLSEPYEVDQEPTPLGERAIDGREYASWSGGSAIGR